MKLNMQLQYRDSPYESTSNLFYYTMRADPVRFPAFFQPRMVAFVRYGNNDAQDLAPTTSTLTPCSAVATRSNASPG